MAGGFGIALELLQRMEDGTHSDWEASWVSGEGDRPQLLLPPAPAHANTLPGVCGTGMLVVQHAFLTWVAVQHELGSTSLAFRLGWRAGALPACLLSYCPGEEAAIGSGQVMVLPLLECCTTVLHLDHLLIPTGAEGGLVLQNWLCWQCCGPQGGCTAGCCDLGGSAVGHKVAAATWAECKPGRRALAVTSLTAGEFERMTQEAWDQLAKQPAAHLVLLTWAYLGGAQLHPHT